MRARALIAALCIVVVQPAWAEDWSVGGRGNPFALKLGPAAPTDADLARREADRDARTRTDEMARTLGIDHGRADVIEYRLDDGSDASFTGWFDGRGAAVSLRW